MYRVCFIAMECIKSAILRDNIGYQEGDNYLHFYLSTDVVLDRTCLYDTEKWKIVFCRLMHQAPSELGQNITKKHETGVFRYRLD